MYERIKYDKVHAIKSSLERGEYLNENEVKLSELYAQYFRTRLYRNKSWSSWITWKWKPLSTRLIIS